MFVWCCVRVVWLLFGGYVGVVWGLVCVGVVGGLYEDWYGVVLGLYWGLLGVV